MQTGAAAGGAFGRPAPRPRSHQEQTHRAVRPLWTTSEVRRRRSPERPVRHHCARLHLQIALRKLRNCGSDPLRLTAHAGAQGPNCGKPVRKLRTLRKAAPAPCSPPSAACHQASRRRRAGDHDAHAARTHAHQPPARRPVDNIDHRHQREPRGTRPEAAEFTKFTEPQTPLTTPLLGSESPPSANVRKDPFGRPGVLWFTSSGAAAFPR